MAYESKAFVGDGFRFPVGTEKVRTTEQRSHVQGSGEDKVYSAISLEIKTEADVFHGFLSATATARTIWVKLRSHSFFKWIQ